MHCNALYHIFIFFFVGGPFPNIFGPPFFKKLTLINNNTMGYLALADIKKHLNIDAAFTDDDDYLTSLGTAAEDVVSKYIDYPLSQLQDASGDIPRALKFAMLLWIGTIYSVRESISTSSMTTVPHSLELLCDLYRDYKLSTEK